MDTVYRTPEPDDLELQLLKLIGDLREQLRFRVAEKPRRWVGNLRRMSFARAVQASNSIEGYDASLDDVVAAVDGEPTVSADEETRLAVAGYRDAMTYILQVAEDTAATVDEGLLKSLHFMMLKHRLDKNPGRWRPGAIFVRREATGEIVYEGPDAELVPALIQEMIAELENSSAPVLFRAAMAHLNLVMIHPFSDGNGRMARALQTLVLAREQIVAPVFSSIEEYLGRNTNSYYDILGATGAGGWNPGHDARPWVRFCLTAHYHQARTILRRVQEAEQLYVACGELAAKRGLPERTAGALAEAAYGLRIRNATYRAILEVTEGETVSDLTASRDLRSLVDADLLQPIGEKRGRYYIAQPRLREAREQIRATRPQKDVSDPFKLALGQLELLLN
jgi:Fic family protein